MQNTKELGPETKLLAIHNNLNTKCKEERILKAAKKAARKNNTKLHIKTDHLNNT